MRGGVAPIGSGPSEPAARPDLGRGPAPSPGTEERDPALPVGRGGSGALRGNGERVLLVGRSEDVEEVLRPTLALAGYEVETAGTGAAAVDRMDHGRHHLAIVDTAMPELRRIPRRRLRNGRTPVLFLATGEFLAMLLPEVGRSGEDYLTRPFQITDLLARVRLLLSGQSLGCSDPTLRYGDLVLDDDSCHAWLADSELDLTPAEYRLLRYMVVNAGRVLSKERIADHVWGELRGDNAIERLVSRLRRKVEPKSRGLIRTQRGFGYVLETPRR
jgi:two-component system OmpR family response regulator